MSETVVMEPNIVEMLTTAALLQDIPDFPLLLAATRRYGRNSLNTGKDGEEKVYRQG